MNTGIVCLCLPTRRRQHVCPEEELGPVQRRLDGPCRLVRTDLRALRSSTRCGDPARRGTRPCRCDNPNWHVHRRAAHRRGLAETLCTWCSALLAPHAAPHVATALVPLLVCAQPIGWAFWLLRRILPCLALLPTALGMRPSPFRWLHVLPEEAVGAVRRQLDDGAGLVRRDVRTLQPAGRAAGAFLRCLLRCYAPRGLHLRAAEGLGQGGRRQGLAAHRP